MRIGIDARLGYQQGIGRHVTELINRVSKMGQEHEYIVYLKPSALDTLFQRFKGRPSIRWVPISGTLFGIQEQIDLIRAVQKDRLDLYHVTFDYGTPFFLFCKTVLTIHDAWFEPETFFRSEWTRRYFQFMTRRGVRKAHRVITVSHFVRDKVLKYCIRNQEEAVKIRVIHNGIGEEFTSVESHTSPLMERYGVQNYILYIGVLAKNKNIFRLLEVYARMNRQDPEIPHLVIVGKRHPGIADPISWVEEFGIQKKVLFLGYAPDEMIPELYRGAQLFVLPSLHEGFGFPVLEAMACGTPVVTSNRTALPEVAGDAAILVDPTCPEAIQEGITKGLYDVELRQELVRRGVNRAKEFSWKRMAQQVLKVYKEVYEAG